MTIGRGVPYRERIEENDALSRIFPKKKKKLQRQAFFVLENILFLQAYRAARIQNFGIVS